MKYRIYYFIMIIISMFYINVSAKEVDIYFFVNGGKPNNSDFKVVDSGISYYDGINSQTYTDIIAYRDDTDSAVYNETDIIKKINSIKGMTFQLVKSGKRLVPGKEWKAVNIVKGKSYYYSQSEKYKVSDMIKQLGLEGEDFPSIFLVANWEDGNSNVKDNQSSTTISIKAEKKSIYVNEKLNLSIVYSPSNAPSEKIIWSSSNSNIATVSSNGTVVGVKTGKAKITAKSASGLKATIEITVSSKTIHYALINYNTNEGTLASKHGNSIKVSRNVIYSNKNKNITKIAYGKSTNYNGLPDYNYSPYINIIKKGYKAKQDAEWNTKANGTGKSYNQDKIYKSSDFCDASKKDCTVTLYVNWKLQKYAINYDLTGGNVKGNVTSYTMKSNKITLKNPTKKGYTFLGWTGTGLSKRTKTVTISKGSTGDRKYTAHWKINSAKTPSKYVLRDSILRRKCSDIDRKTNKNVPKYGADIIKYDGVKIAVLKGTEIKKYKEIKDSRDNVHYYQVTIKADGINYLQDYEGYILATDLRDNKIEMDSRESRSLLVNEKTTFIKNALNVIQAGDDESDKIVFKYPTEGAIAIELGQNKNSVSDLRKNDNDRFQRMKSQLRKTGYEFVINNNTSFKTLNTSVGKNIYYFSCTSFANTLYSGTFEINPKYSNGNYYLLGGYLTDAQNKKQFYKVKTITAAGKKLYTSEMQIGDAVIGMHDKECIPANGKPREGHIMVYIGDGLIVHSTSSEVGPAADEKYTSLHINYLNSTYEGITNYYSVLGKIANKNPCKHDHAYEESITLIRILKDKKKPKSTITYSKADNKFEIK